MESGLRIPRICISSKSPGRSDAYGPGGKITALFLYSTLPGPEAQPWYFENSESVDTHSLFHLLALSRLDCAMRTHLPAAFSSGGCLLSQLKYDWSGGGVGAIFSLSCYPLPKNNQLWNVCSQITSTRDFIVEVIYGFWVVSFNFLVVQAPLPFSPVSPVFIMVDFNCCLISYLTPRPVSHITTSLSTTIVSSILF
jgi:hypothetical protein